MQLDESASRIPFVLRYRIAETLGYYGEATFHGIHEDNDPNKRLLLVANYNHDLGELWEFSDTGFVKRV